MAIDCTLKGRLGYGALLHAKAIRTDYRVEDKNGRTLVYVYPQGATRDHKRPSDPFKCGCDLASDGLCEKFNR